ncbi:MAG: putative glycosyltransferase (TIGR04348 family) [Gammaproteobacteria bacterium]|jgi:putative glycosyltransferase (TIGR04348 family)
MHNFYCMKIHLVTPAKKNSKSGNRATALRWAKLLKLQGHAVTIGTDYKGESTDLLIALHAWRSAAAVNRYRQCYPRGPLVVALGGTDVNSYLKTDPQTTLKSMATADALVCLHDLIELELPVELRHKLHVIYQSASTLPQCRKPRSKTFDICVIGHLREEKDPFRTALAARLLAPDSKILITHLGKAHNRQWCEKALQESAQNPRYEWKAEVPRWRVRQELARTRVMVISSIQEGGANVVSEALVAGVPILASRISGNVGLLGVDYPGYYPVGDEVALADLLVLAETDPAFLSRLEHCCLQLSTRFTPESEAAAWAGLIASMIQPVSTT